jgi:hypothetical protein
MVKPYNWSLHCSSTCKVNIFIHMYDLIWLIICTHTYTSIWGNHTCTLMDPLKKGKNTRATTRHHAKCFASSYKHHCTT